MSKLISRKTALLYASAIMLGIVLGPFLAGLAGGLWAAVSQPSPARAAEAVPAPVLDPDSPDDVYTCTPDYIGAFSNRIHVRCTLALNGTIFYFAAPTSDSRNAARVLSIMLTAKALGKNVRIYYTLSSSGAAYGCQTGDCRPIDAIELMP